MGRYEIIAKTTIAAEPTQVWAVLDDFHGWPYWMPSMKNLRVDLLTPGLPRPGYRFRLRGRMAYADLEVMTYAELERATRFRMNMPPLSGNNRCLMFPLGNGYYQIERQDTLNLPGPVVAFLDVTQRKRFEQLAGEFLLSLKRTVEQRVAAANASYDQSPY